MANFWDWLLDTVHALLVGIYRTLGPVAGWIDSIGFAARREMDRVSIPLAVQGWIIAAVWAVVLVGMVWALRGRLRVLAIVVIAVVLVRYFQFLPGV